KNSMPARSAICATSTTSCQCAAQRSRTRVSVSPPSALAEKTPSLKRLGPCIGCSIHAPPCRATDNAGMKELRVKHGNAMRIVCIGGGPAGLYFAILMKLRDPAHRITVIERNRPDDTFGWGVVFSDETLRNLKGGDTETELRISD